MEHSRQEDEQTGSLNIIIESGDESPETVHGGTKSGPSAYNMFCHGVTVRCHLNSNIGTVGLTNNTTLF